MNKIFFAAIALLISVATHAQDEKYGYNSMPFNDNGKVIFSQVVSQESKSADVLYAACKSALADIFVSSKDAIQMDDAESHTIVAKGNKKISNVTLNFALKIQTKDNRYKIEMYDIVYHATVSNLPPTEWRAEELTDDNCINKKKGVCKTNGYGYARRLVIDTWDEMYSAISENVSSSLAHDENW